MELTRGGNNNSVYIRIVDCFVEVGVNLGAGTGDLSALLCAFFEYVADCNDLCVADAVLDAFNVFTADHAAADQCNVQVFHDEFLLKNREQLFRSADDEFRMVG